MLQFQQVFLLGDEDGHGHGFEDYGVAGVSAGHGVVPAHVHQLVEGCLLRGWQGIAEALPGFDLVFQCQPVGGYGFAQRLSLCVSDVGDVGVDEVLFGYGFVDEVLDGRVQVAAIVGAYDFFCKIG
jgi:hypothetical protein